MRAWWESRAPREQALIALGGALLALVLLGQFVVAPALQARGSAADRYERAAALYDTVMARTPLAAATSSGAFEAVRIDDLRNTAADAARRRGLAVSRLQTSGDGGLVVGLEAADPQLLFAWLIEMRAAPGGEVSRATLTRVDSGQVRASVEFGGAEP